MAENITTSTVLATAATSNNAVLAGCGRRRRRGLRRQQGAVQRGLQRFHVTTQQVGAALLSRVALQGLDECLLFGAFTAHARRQPDDAAQAASCAGLCRAVVLHHGQRPAAGPVGHRPHAAPHQVHGHGAAGQQLLHHRHQGVFGHRQGLVGQHPVAVHAQLGGQLFAHLVQVAPAVGQVDGGLGSGRHGRAARGDGHRGRGDGGDAAGAVFAAQLLQALRQRPRQAADAAQKLLPGLVAKSRVQLFRCTVFVGPACTTRSAGTAGSGSTPAQQSW